MTRCARANRWPRCSRAWASSEHHAHRPDPHRPGDQRLQPRAHDAAGLRVLRHLRGRADPGAVARPRPGRRPPAGGRGLGPGRRDRAQRARLGHGRRPRRAQLLRALPAQDRRGPACGRSHRRPGAATARRVRGRGPRRRRGRTGGAVPPDPRARRAHRARPGPPRQHHAQDGGALRRHRRPPHTAARPLRHRRHRHAAAAAHRARRGAASHALAQDPAAVTPGAVPDLARADEALV